MFKLFFALPAAAAARIGGQLATPPEGRWAAARALVVAAGVAVAVGAAPSHTNFVIMPADDMGGGALAVGQDELLLPRGSSNNAIVCRQNLMLRGIVYTRVFTRRPHLFAALARSDLTVARALSLELAHAISTQPEALLDLLYILLRPAHVPEYALPHRALERRRNGDFWVESPLPALEDNHAH